MPSGDRHYKWAGEAVSYAVAHVRLRGERGSASEYACVDCGDLARDWSYDHGAPDERVHDRGRHEGCAYSLDFTFYSPRCKLCHRRYDVAARAA